MVDLKPEPSLSGLGHRLLKSWWTSRVDWAWMTWRCHFRLAIEAGADPIMSIKDRCLTNVWRYCDETHKKELEVEGKSDPLKGFPSMSISIQVLPSSCSSSCGNPSSSCSGSCVLLLRPGPDFLCPPLPFGRLHSSYSTHFSSESRLKVW